MTKSELIDAFSAKAEITKKDARAYIEALGQVVADVMKAGDKVAVFDGITLTSKVQPACKKRNPMNGEIVDCPEKIRPICKFGTAIKGYLND